MKLRLACVGVIKADPDRASPVSRVLRIGLLRMMG